MVPRLTTITFLPTRCRRRSVARSSTQWSSIPVIDATRAPSQYFNLNSCIARTLSTLRFCTGAFVRIDRPLTLTLTAWLHVVLSRFDQTRPDQTSSRTLSSVARSRPAVEAASPVPHSILFSFRRASSLTYGKPLGHHSYHPTRAYH